MAKVVGIRVRPIVGEPRQCPARTADGELVSGAAAGIVGSEWRWLATVALAALLVIEVPYLLAYRRISDGYVFVGMFWSAHDFAQYGAAMREGAASTSWLIHDHLTHEPHAPALMYTPYVALGKLAGGLGLDFQIAYHLSEAAARGALLVAIYAFAAAVLPRADQRRIALIVVAFSSGLATLLAIAARIVGIDVPVSGREFNQPEVSTFLALFTAPHLMLGLALLLLAARCYLASWSAPSLTSTVATIAVVAGLGLTNSFSLITLCAVVVAHLGLAWLVSRRVPLAAVTNAVAVLLAAGPFLVYSGLVFGRDPFWSAVYVRQNVLPSPPPLDLALGLGAVLALAAIGLPRFLQRPSPGRWLVVVWITLSLALMYAPVEFQRRFAYGLHPMVGLGAAVGLEPVWRWVRRERRTSLSLARPILAFGLAQALFGSTVFLYLFAVVQVSALPARAGGGDAVQARMTDPGDGSVFQPVALRAAGQWLTAAMGPDDVVLAQTSTANYLAGIIPGRVFVGHWVGTLDFSGKGEAMRRFYRAELDADERQGLLRSGNIRYVVYGPHERALGAHPPADPYLATVFANAEVTIYGVELGALAADRQRAGR